MSLLQAARNYETWVEAALAVALLEGEVGSGVLHHLAEARKKIDAAIAAAEKEFPPTAQRLAGDLVDSVLKLSNCPDLQIEAWIRRADGKARELQTALGGGGGQGGNPERTGS